MLQENVLMNRIFSIFSTPVRTDTTSETVRFLGLLMEMLYITEILFTEKEHFL